MHVYICAVLIERSGMDNKSENFSSNHANVKADVLRDPIVNHHMAGAGISSSYDL